MTEESSYKSVKNININLSGITVGDTIYVNGAQVVGLLLECADAVEELFPEAAKALKTVASAIDDVVQEAYNARPDQ